MDRIDVMRTFLRVAELGSFTQAADSLGLSKASISSAIRELETALGARLLQRTTRKVQMTPDGLLFYGRCRDMLAELDEVQTMFQNDNAALTGRLRVDMPIGVARNIVIPALPAFLGAHPRLQVELSSTDRRVDAVREGFDCVLRAGVLENSSLVARPLGHFELVNCASPAYLARHGLPRTPAELHSHFLVDYAPGLAGRPALFEYMEGGARRTCEVPAALAVNNSDAYQAACLAGLGIIQAPRAGMIDLLAQGRLVSLLEDFQAPPMPVTLLYSSRRHLSKRVRCFMDWLAGVLQPYLA
ncbi:LysR family transcriptional regulator [Noviherbaspirillum galbum]|uniref:LysR family transcriptional regulator n=1 Tax=Noviherbaspirillum galbum TaxID=2709383 RepID=A0A6B3SS29_9BURK|nr:LysR family transcriptional regulator [Noviherbaspirillum galbum]NEX61252.1 LysR family transcriptional regulator [Noviherbaspirillum galbum]